MRKVIKILVKVLSAAVLLAIVLPLVVSLLLDIPTVQNFIVHRAADFASEHLQTRVRIDRVNIGLLNKVRVYGFYVEDYQQDTLLYVDRLQALLTGVGLFGEGLVFGDARITGGKLFIVETPDSVMNIKQVVDRISKRNGKGNFRLTINSAEVSDFELRIERLEHRNPESGVDYGNMRLRDMEAHIDNLTIAGSNVSGQVYGLAFNEISGFELNSMEGSFEVDKGFVGLSGARLRTDESDIQLESLTLTGGAWSEYKDFINNVEIVAEARKSVVSSRDVGFFAPKIARWHTTVSDLDVIMRGTVDNFIGTVSRSRINGVSELVADVKIKGLPDYRSSRFAIEINRLYTNSRQIETLARNIAGVELKPAITDILSRAGGIVVAGGFNGTLESFRTRGRIAAAEGNVRFDAAMQPDTAARHRITARAGSRRFDLGRILDRKMLGDTGFDISAEGAFGEGEYAMNIDADIPLFTVGGYACDSIKVSGSIADGDIRADMTVRDANLDFDLLAVADMHPDEEPEYRMLMDLRHADLAALGINGRDTVSVLSAEIGVDARGRIPDELNGSMRIASAHYAYDTGEVDSERINITVESNEDTRSLRLTSDFADARFESRNDYRDVLAYVKQLVGSYMPLLYGGEGAHGAGHSDGEEDDHLHSVSLLSLTAKNFNPIADAISSGLQVADNAQVDILLDPVCDRFMMRANADYIERDRLLATSLRLNATNEGDSLSMRMSADDIYVGTLHLPEVKLSGSALDNRISVDGSFLDTVRTYSGSLGVAATLRRDSITGRRGVDIDIRPSYMASSDNRWDISAARISADSSRIDIDNFAVRNSRQELLVNGVASRSREDSLMLTLHDFDVSPFTQIANRIGYTIEGRTNGYATVKSALHGSNIVADIRLDSLEINSMPVKALDFDTRWDFERNRARFTIATVAERDTVVRGFYIPSEVRYLARLTVDSLDMALLDPMLQGVISETRGKAAADLTLEGRRREAELKGDILVSGLSTKVDFTQVTYSLPEPVSISVRDNVFNVEPVTVCDSEGNEGEMWFNLSLNHLSNIAYTLNVVPENMLVLNTTSRDNDYFYGKVYASGAATIDGDKSGVRLDIVASTDDNSEFYMPLSNKSNISNADFVIFESADRPDTTDFLVRKKLMFERRQKQRTSSSGGMDINMALDVKPNAQVQLVIDPTVGDIIKGRGEGSLNIHVNPKANIFEMYGDYTISEGSYLFTLQNIINKKFIIESGSTIQWSGEPLDALLNIDAVYKLKASLQPLLAGSVSSSNVPTRAVPVECVIHLADRLTSPSVTFDVVVPNADPDVQSLVANALSTSESRSQQFLYLLVANSFISEASADVSGNIGVTASAATGFELLSNQLSNWLSADTYNIVIRYRPKTEMTSDEVDIGFSTGLVNNRLLLEVEGNYLVDRSMAVNQSSNIMGEAYLTWLIDRAGNLRLKGFTHTIDRFDENQGLQETGIGIYYKESFNNLKDLKQRVKERFTLRNRRNRRQKAEAEPQSENDEVVATENIAD